MKTSFKSMAMTAVGLVIGVSVWAATPDDAQKVLSEIHLANQMEIQMGLMAKQKGSVSGVRDYGDQLVKDHTDSDQKVTLVSQKDSIALLPSKTRSKDINTMMDLSNLTGADFDKAFITQMIKDHQENITKLQNAQKTLPEGDVRDLVGKTLPTLQLHLKEAEHLQKGV